MALGSHGTISVIFSWMSTDGEGTKCRTNIAENFNCLIRRVHERYRQIDDRETDRRQTDGRQHLANVNVSLRSLKHRNVQNKQLGHEVVSVEVSLRWEIFVTEGGFEPGKKSDCEGVMDGESGEW